MKTITPFTKLFEKAAYGQSYPQVFDDFLEMCICSFTRNFNTGLSHYEDKYLEIIKPYKANGTLKYFPELLGEMILYMEEYKDASEGNDLLGEFFQQNISFGKRNGQFFTPGHITDFMAKITGVDEETEHKNILDPACGSGRMLLSAAKNSKAFHRYYGVDIDSTCVKMTAINMFLNGLRGEVLCGNALFPDDFRFSYKISFLPLGIFKITEKENSLLWHMNIASFGRKESLPMQNKPELGQLVLF